MKNILIIGVALFMGVSLSSCNEDEVRPMAISPTGFIDDPGTGTEFPDDGTFNDDFIDEPVDEFELGDDGVVMNDDL